MDVEGTEMRQTSKFKRICVFCGSSQGKKSSYQDAATELGKELVYCYHFNDSHFCFMFCFVCFLSSLAAFMKLGSYICSFLV